MKIWLEDKFHALHSIKCEQKLFELIASHGRELGFEHCAYGLRMPLPLTQPKIAMFNNYPIEWQQRYVDANYVAIDPSVQHGMHSQIPVIWSENLFSKTRDFWEDATSFGLNVGWAQSSHDAHGVKGMLTLSRSSDLLTDLELRGKITKMMWLTQMAHLGMSNIVTPKFIPEIGAQLSHREIEILRWTGDGKTSSEISDILNISERTVNFHINNSITKLNAANKAAAVIKAAILGMLY